MTHHDEDKARTEGTEQTHEGKEPSAWLERDKATDDRTGDVGAKAEELPGAAKRGAAKSMESLGDKLDRVDDGTGVAHTGSASK